MSEHDLLTTTAAACPTCGAPGQLRYCPSCGQRRLEGRHTLRRLGLGLITRVIGEEGLIHTAVQLSLRPARVIRDYLAGRTVRYVNPVGYLLVAVAVFTLVGRALNGATGAPESDRLWSLLVIPFIALFSRLLHFRGPYNLAEHLILVTYLAAQVLALLTLLYFGMLLVPTASEPTYAVVALGLALAFFVWGYSAVFDRPRPLAALLGVLSLALGAVTWFAILLFLVGLLRK